jgi:hypothetical protein
MNAPWRVIPAAVALLVCGSAAAVDEAAFAKCGTLDDPSERLACYDALAGRAATADFGKEAPQVAENPDETLNAHIAGSLKSLTRNSIVKLDNGQSWKLIGDDNAYFPNLPDNAEVVITRGFLGAYWMQIPAINRRFKVRRVL